MEVKGMKKRAAGPEMIGPPDRLVTPGASSGPESGERKRNTAESLHSGVVPQLSL